MAKITTKSLKKRADKLWSEIVRKRDGKCMKCGRTTNLQAHHIFSRKFNNTRWNIDNGITLCYGCHLFWAHIEHENFRDLIIGLIGEAKYFELKNLSSQIKKIDKIGLESIINSLAQ